MLPYSKVRLNLSNPREEGSHDHHEQKTDVPANHLHGVRDVEQGRGSGDHVRREQSSHDELLSGADRVGPFLLDVRDGEPCEGAEEAAQPDVDCWEGEPGSGQVGVHGYKVCVVAG